MVPGGCTGRYSSVASCDTTQQLLPRSPSPYLSTVSKDDTGAPRVLIQEISHIVHLALNYDPTRVPVIMLCDFASTKHLRDPKSARGNRPR